MAKVLVQHETRYNGNGDAIGVARRQRGHAIQNVEVEYLHQLNGHRTVRTTSGDVWSVRPILHADYNFVTVGDHA